MRHTSPTSCCALLMALALLTACKSGTEPITPKKESQPTAVATAAEDATAEKSSKDTTVTAKPDKPSKDTTEASGQPPTTAPKQPSTPQTGAADVSGRSTQVNGPEDWVIHFRLTGKGWDKYEGKPVHVLFKRKEDSEGQMEDLRAESVVKSGAFEFDLPKAGSTDLYVNFFALYFDATGTCSEEHILSFGMYTAGWNDAEVLQIDLTPDTREEGYLSPAGKEGLCKYWPAK